MEIKSKRNAQKSELLMKKEESPIKNTCLK